MTDRGPIHQRGGWSQLKSHPAGARSSNPPRRPPLPNERRPAPTGGQRRKEVMSATPVGTRPRLDLHNASIDFVAATAGQCGFTHLPSGGVCRLPHRHLGPCQLKHPADPGDEMPRCGETPA